MPEDKVKTMTITVKYPGKDLTAVLRRPLFDEFRMAAMALQVNSEGKMDTLACGRQLVKLCWVSGDARLKNADSRLRW